MLIKFIYIMGIWSSRICIYSCILIMHLLTYGVNNSGRWENYKKKDCKLYRKLINLLDMDLEKVTTFLLHRIECWNVLGPSVSPYIISPAMGGGIYIYICSGLVVTLSQIVFLCLAHIFSFFLESIYFTYIILLKRRHKGGYWVPNATNMKYLEWSLSQKRSRNSEIQFL